MHQKADQIRKIDALVIGAGIFGLYATYLLSSRGLKVAVVEKSLEAFCRASSINQARIHNGYHYPRSHETASKAAGYFDRFCSEFDFAVNNSFQHLYAVASKDSKVNAAEFLQFCRNINVPAEEVNGDYYFVEGTVEKVFKVNEPVFSFSKIRDYLLEKISDRASLYYGHEVKNVEVLDESYIVSTDGDLQFQCPLAVNATYANVNKVIELFKDDDCFNVKYEFCEVAFCRVSNKLCDYGFTVMDGDFFSVIPFGQENYYSITSVSHTPHITLLSEKELNEVVRVSGVCDQHKLSNCYVCSLNLSSNWKQMQELQKYYLKSGFETDYISSKFDIKPILVSSEEDDSRPTVFRVAGDRPKLVSVLSGKISSIYDLEYLFDQIL